MDPEARMDCGLMDNRMRLAAANAPMLVLHTGQGSLAQRSRCWEGSHHGQERERACTLLVVGSRGVVAARHGGHMGGSRHATPRCSMTRQLGRAPILRVCADLSGVYATNVFASAAPLLAL